MILIRRPVPSGRAGLEIGTDAQAKPLEAAEFPPGSRFSDFLARPVTASARHGNRKSKTLSERL